MKFMNKLYETEFTWTLNCAQLMLFLLSYYRKLLGICIYVLRISLKRYQILDMFANCFCVERSEIKVFNEFSAKIFRKSAH